MEDDAIIQLFWERSERAIEETKIKYGKYCHSIAFNILGNPEDSEECVNDTYLRVWNSIPPNRPQILTAYVGKVTRNLALDRVRARTADRRGGGETALALDELEDCVSGGDQLTRREDSREIISALNGFLETLTADERNVFMRRYWSMEPVADIARRCGMSESRAASMLHRMRGRLKKYLLKEGITL